MFWACHEPLTEYKNTMNPPEVWACPKLLLKIKRTMNPPEVCACIELLSRKKQNNESSTSLGLHRTTVEE